MSPFRLAWLDLWRRPLSTLIALVAIAVSVAGSGILLRLNQIARDRITRLGEGGDALVGAKAGGLEMVLGALGGEGEYPDFLPAKLYDSLRAEQTVNFADGAQEKPTYLRGLTPFLYFGKFHQAKAIGTDVSFFARETKDTQFKFIKGNPFKEPREIVLGAHAKGEVGEKIEVQPWAGETTHTTIEFKVSGKLAETHSAWDDAIYASVKDAQDVLSQIDLSQKSIWGANVLNYFLVDLHPNGFEHLAILINRRTVGEAIKIEDAKQKLKELTGTGADLGRGITALVLTLAALSVASLLITRFEALALQLAVLRAIGYTKVAIATWLLGEGLMLGAVATIVGATIDNLFFPTIRNLLGNALPSADLVPSQVWTSAPVWLGAMAAVTTSVIVPLIRLYRQDVATALRT